VGEALFAAEEAIVIFQALRRGFEELGQVVESGKK
jgi:hypothetical protein